MESRTTLKSNRWCQDWYSDVVQTKFYLVVIITIYKQMLDKDEKTLN